MHSVNIPAKFEVRSFTHSWDNRGYLKKLGSPWIRPCSLFSQIFNGLLFPWTLWIYLSNLKFVALRVPEITGGTGKIWTVPGYAHAPFSRKFLTGFCSDGPCEYTCHILKFVALCIPEIIGVLYKLRDDVTSDVTKPPSTIRVDHLDALCSRWFC